MNKAILHTAIDLLSRREHSVNELVNKLRQREYLPAEIEQTITYLLDNNYLSEQRFAESVYRSRVNKGYGKNYIESELRHKGVSQAIIATVADELAVNWYDIAAQSYRKKFNDRSISDQKDKAKRIRFLQYRGFSSDEIFSVLSEAHD